MKELTIRENFEKFHSEFNLNKKKSEFKNNPFPVYVDLIVQLMWLSFQLAAREYYAKASDAVIQIYKENDVEFKGSKPELLDGE